MPRGDGTGPGRMGGGQGQGKRGGRPGRMSGAGMAGQAGFCLCPQCGHKEVHERGIPCFERQCLKCGTIMTRQ